MRNPSSTRSSERIAIVGVGGIFPGAQDLTTFWNNIAAGVDSGRPVPPDRWFLRAETALDSDGPKADRVYSTWGCFIEGFQFDPTGLDLDPGLLSRLDPLFHLGLHAARAAVFDAGQLRETDRARVGVILGNIVLPTESTSALCRDILGRTFIERLLETVPIPVDQQRELRSNLDRRLGHRDWHPQNRLAASLPAGLIAKGLGLGGLSYTLDAACASSLYALKFSCEELLGHRADAMLAGGMSRPDCQYTQMGFAQLKALSRRGRCAPLSAAADGLVVGEGAGVFVLKRLSDAIAAGDQIYAVIAGVGLSNDRGANLLAPHSEGQLRAMRSAYDQAGWRPSDVDLIECHATGTPVGDGVEIDSLHQLWSEENARPGQCVIGGVKSNVGHLLTGAGAAGLMKVLYAIRHRTLPPTANYEEPASGLTKADSPFRVLAQAEPWSRRRHAVRTNAQDQEQPVPFRATVNAFGFGGINAHLLIEEFLDTDHRSQPAAKNLESPSMRISAGPRHGQGHRATDEAEPLNIAVVGLAVVTSQSASIDEGFLRDCYSCHSFPSVPNENDWGVQQTDWFRQTKPNPQTNVITFSPFSSVRLPLGEFRIPPLEMQDMLPQQQLMLMVAAEALKDFESGQTNAGGSADKGLLSNRTGVFVGIELDPNTTNFHLRWSVEEQASAWAETLGFVMTPDELSEWIARLKDAAGPPLTANRVMGNLGGIVASRLAREFNVGGPSFAISSGEHSGLRACELAAQALRRGELDQAVVGAVDLPCDVRNQVAISRDGEVPSLESIQDGATAVVLKRWEDAVRDGDRIHAVISRFQAAAIATRALTNSTADPIRLAPDDRSFGAATGLLTLAAAVISLRGRILPGTLPSYWLQNRDEGSRRIEIQGRGHDGKNVVVELTEPPAYNGVLPVERRQCSVSGPLPAGLFVIDGNSMDELNLGLQQLAELVDSVTSVDRLARIWFGKRPPRSDHSMAMAIVVKSVDEFRTLIPSAHERLRLESAARDFDRRITFTSQPLGIGGRLSFVFPGSGNAFLGMGRELLASFPGILRDQEAENERLRDQYRPELIWFGRSTSELLEDHKAMIFGQVAIGTAICDLLGRFGVRPTASIGYSLGESAALFGLRAWTDRDEMLARMDAASLFGSDLVSPFAAARRAWNIPEGSEVPWVSGLVDRCADEIRSVIDSLAANDKERRSRRVYLLIVNTSNQCVIGGDRTQVDWVVKKLSATFVPFAAPSSVHCDVLRQVERAYRQLHLMRTSVSSSSRPIDFYSTAWSRPYPLTQDSAADAIVAQAVDTIDFPKVVERAYADGIRLFFEIGPGSSCTRMIDEILGDRPHVAKAVAPATANPVEAFLESIATLIAHRIPADLSYLYGFDGDPKPNGRKTGSVRDVVTVVGGTLFQIPTPAGGWKLRPQALHAPRVDKVSPLPAVTSWEPPVPPVVAFPAEPQRGESLQSDESGLDLDFETTQREQDTAIFNFEPHGMNVMTPLDELFAARAKAHEAYLRVSAQAHRIMADQLERLARISQSDAIEPVESRDLDWSPDPIDPQKNDPEEGTDRGKVTKLAVSSNDFSGNIPGPKINAAPPEQDFLPAVPLTPPRSLSRRQCMEFAIGKIGRVLGEQFAGIDQFPTRVRLPDEPLMLVDRILEIDGEPLSMTSGRVVTEHDIHPDAWYLDCGRIPTCIAVEAGQADLFLSGWLGIDFETKGVACYRLLDAVVTFHRELPGEGQTIHYDIRINHFFRQGQTYLFRFEFDATVNGQPLLTMREGCAGFFTQAELAGGKGIVHTALDRQPRPGKRPADWKELVPMGVESYDDSQLLALRRGQLDVCFGHPFAGLSVTHPVTLPGLKVSESGGSIADSRSRMWLIDRVLKLDPDGGKFGLGTILGELDIHEDDWFITCHFCDDQVMPGTLMYECCMHTLRIFLLRMGWIGETGQVAYEPIPGVRSRLKCRGQVLATTKKVWYEITLKEIGYSEPGASTNAQAPWCLADALMYADGKPIVEITDMSVRLSGLTRETVERLWMQRQALPSTIKPAASNKTSTGIHRPYDRHPALFDTDRITAFAIGNPSVAFGDRYRPFDSERIIARLPGPPFQFLDRIVAISGCQPWVLQAGGEVVAQYDIPPDAWYFASNRQSAMPFAVLLETALQPCGWLAAYVGSALTSEIDLSFRNLGGTATQFRQVTAESGTLSTTVKMTKVSNSGGMIIQHYDFDLRCEGEPVYVGNTYFGFFSKASLKHQIGIRDAKPLEPSAAETSRAHRFPYIDAAPFADSHFQMIDNVQLSLTDGPYDHGFVIGTTDVDATSWFFKAHFHQDPVVPGSLGLESFFQLVKVYASRRWRLSANAQFATPILNRKHEWVYRGQVIPIDKQVTVSAVIKSIDDTSQELTAEGFLSVDGRIIYQMKEFSLGVVS